MIAYFSTKRERGQVAAVLTAVALGLLPACTNLQNDRPRSRAEGTLTGTAAGGTSGVDAGGAVKPKEGNVEQESALGDQFDLLARKIARLKADNAKLREFATAKEQQLATVLASDRSAGPTVLEFDLRTSIQSEIGRADRAARSWQETIDAHKAVLKGTAGDARGPELEAEVNRLAGERSELLLQRDRLISISKKLGE
jgi:hypothetical protein